MFNYKKKIKNYDEISFVGYTKNSKFSITMREITMYHYTKMDNLNFKFISKQKWLIIYVILNNCHSQSAYQFIIVYNNLIKNDFFT